MRKIFEISGFLVAAFCVLLVSNQASAQQLQCRNWMTIIVPPETDISCERLFGDDWHVKSTRSESGLRCSLCSPEDVISGNPDLVTDPATLAEIARRGRAACASVPKPVAEPWIFYNPNAVGSSSTYWFAANQEYFCHPDGFWWTSSIYHWFDCPSAGSCSRNDYYDGSVVREIAQQNGLRRWEFAYTSGAIRIMGPNY